MAVNIKEAAVAHALSCLQHDRLVLRDKQLEAVKLLYEGQDVFLWVPTGYGKSICYQMLPFLLDVKLGRTIDNRGRGIGNVVQKFVRKLDTVSPFSLLP